MTPPVSVGEIYQGTEYSSECEDGSEPLLPRDRGSAAIFMLLEEQAEDALPQEDQKARFLSRLPAMGKPIEPCTPRPKPPSLGRSRGWGRNHPERKYHTQSHKRHPSNLEP